MEIVVATRPTLRSFTRRITDNFVQLGAHEQPRTRPIERPCDLLIQYGFHASPALRSAIAGKIPFVILDRGYFDPTRSDRNSISINGHHGLAMELDVLDRPPRWHPEIKPWRTDVGSRIYVIGQVHGDASLRGIDVEAWMNRTAAAAQSRWQMPVVKRPHPKQLESWEPALPPLPSIFEDAHVIITYTSTAGVQSVLAGVPTVAMHPASPAYPCCAGHMARHAPLTREEHMHQLSWREYTLTDIEECALALEVIGAHYKPALEQAKAGKYDRPPLC